MDSLTNFGFKGNQVRVILLENEPWFVAKDVATVLEYIDVRRMLDLVDEEDKQIINPQKLDLAKIAESFNNSTFRLSILNESGLYAVIFGSHKPEAKIFKRWVTSEVLPSIRKTGKYEVKSQPEQSPYIVRLNHFNFTKKFLPKNHWCVFGETANLLSVISEKYPVGVYDLVDGSVGKRWALYRNDNEWCEPRLQYPHHFPDQRGIKDAWCYSFKELPFFREWFQDIYEPTHLPKYLWKKYGELIKG